MKKLKGLILILALALCFMAVTAQNESSTPIEFEGTVEAINGTTITVAGLTVDISTLDSAVIAVLKPGMTITISGNLNGTTIIAITIDLPDEVEATPEATEVPEVTETPPAPESTETPSSDNSGVSVIIYISVDGGTTWDSADDDIEAEPETEILVRFVVINVSGTTLTAIDLSGTNFDISLCNIPDELGDGADFDCTTTIIFHSDDDLELVVIVIGNLNGVTITISHSADVSEDDDNDDDGMVIVIEGPVDTIQGNQITIFNFTIVLASDDPMLTVIQIGDVLRIEGDWDDNQPVIIAITIIVINIDVYVFNGEAWRDPGSCNNAPPPWAPAHGWRRRCQSSGGNNGNSGGSGGSNGRGRGRGGSGRGRGSS